MMRFSYSGASVVLRAHHRVARGLEETLPGQLKIDEAQRGVLLLDALEPVEDLRGELLELCGIGCQTAIIQMGGRAAGYRGQADRDHNQDDSTPETSLLTYGNEAR